MRIRETLRQIPSPLAGLSLGISGLGTALEHAFPTGYWLPAATALALPLTLLVLLKLALCPDVLKKEMRHPVLGSLPVAVSMVLMFSSVVIRPLAPAISLVMWFTGMCIAVIGMAVFYFFQMAARKKENLLPSYFLALGGLLVVAMTVPRPEWAGLANGLMIFGDAVFFAVFTPVLWRAVRGAPLPPALMPVTAIFAAPCNLLIASWIAVYGTAPTGIWLVFCLGTMLNIWMYVLLPSFVRLPFSPAQGSLTFPMTITATAAFKLSAFWPALKVIAYGELCVAAAVVACVCVRYILYFAALRRSPAGAGKK